MTCTLLPRADENVESYPEKNQHVKLRNYDEKRYICHCRSYKPTIVPISYQITKNENGIWLETKGRKGPVYSTVYVSRKIPQNHSISMYMDFQQEEEEKDQHTNCESKKPNFAMGNERNPSKCQQFAQ